MRGKGKVHIFIDNITNQAGTERAVVNLANNLSGHGHHTIIYSLYSVSGGPVYPIASAVKIVHMKLDSYRLSSWPSILSFAYLFRAVFVQTRHLQGALIGTGGTLNILLSILGKREQKTIACEHFNYDSATPFIRFMRDRFVRHADYLVVLTKDDAEIYLSQGYRNIIVIPNEISFEASGKPNYNALKLLAVGRLTVEKGFDILIRMMIPVLRTHDSWELYIYGRGEMEQQLREMIEQSSLQERIFIMPPSNEIEKVYLSSSIFLFPSRYEGFGLVLLEAKTSGLPTVAFNCPSGPSTIIVDKEDGFLIPLGDEAEFQRRTTQLMDDISLRQQMGQQGQINAQAFDSEHIYQLWQKILD
ncbi:glycosyltransferase family 4 protein [Deinococcus sp. Marseille-Q6407]|uniref:glycosyltransferase family 4 protein n=1 Tax=Deinococcus sp. Marseille-Q6407 TaxID=2969223 RepID=UPI0021BEE1D1|nr:glycosyltransferase family 4 protein [Deinococcus sp. Marseille-Q6407]